MTENDVVIFTTSVEEEDDKGGSSSSDEETEDVSHGKRKRSAKPKYRPPSSHVVGEHKDELKEEGEDEDEADAEEHEDQQQHGAASSSESDMSSSSSSDSDDDGGEPNTPPPSPMDECIVVFNSGPAAAAAAAPTPTKKKRPSKKPAADEEARLKKKEEKAAVRFAQQAQNAQLKKLAKAKKPAREQQIMRNLTGIRDTDHTDAYWLGLTQDTLCQMMTRRGYSNSKWHRSSATEFEAKYKHLSRFELSKVVRQEVLSSGRWVPGPAARPDNFGPCIVRFVPFVMKKLLPTLHATPRDVFHLILVFRTRQTDLTQNELDALARNNRLVAKKRAAELAEARQQERKKKKNKMEEEEEEESEALDKFKRQSLQELYIQTFTEDELYIDITNPRMEGKPSYRLIRPELAAEMKKHWASVSWVSTPLKNGEDPEPHLLLPDMAVRFHDFQPNDLVLERVLGDSRLCTVTADRDRRFAINRKLLLKNKQPAMGIA